MGMLEKMRGWVLCGLLSLGFSQEAQACAFHGYTPDPTLVDVLLATEQVVIVQIDAERSDRFQTVEALMGPDAVDIPLAVAPQTRADLTRNPDARILLARDGAYGSWLELALLDSDYESVIRQIMAQQSRWQLGGDEARLRLFADHLNAANPELRRLALQELDRAPYAALRKLRLPQVRGLRQDLQRDVPDLIPIRVLLAGLSNDQSYSPLLKDQMREAIRTDLPYLGAYATALIELQGPAAVEYVISGPLASGTLSPTVEEKLLQALAIQYKAAPAATRRAITSGMADLVRRAPHLREPAARQFGYRNHWSLSRPGGTSAATSGAGADR